MNGDGQFQKLVKKVDEIEDINTLDSEVQTLQPRGLNLQPRGLNGSVATQFDHFRHIVYTVPMTFSPLLQKSIHFAIQVHAGQFRKGKDIPYITHPLTVGLILSRVTTDENIICAGILHDTIEDCDPYGSVTRKILEL